MTRLEPQDPAPAAIQNLTGIVGLLACIERLGLGIRVDAQHRSIIALRDVGGPQFVSRAEHAARAGLCLRLGLERRRGVSDALFDSSADFGGECLWVEGLAGGNADPGKAGEHILFRRDCRHEGQKRVEIGDEADAFRLGAIPDRPVDGRRGRGRRRAGEGRKRPQDIIRLHRLQCGDIVRPEQLGPGEGAHEICLGAEDLRDALGHGAVPARTGEEVVPRLATGGARAGIGEVVGIEVEPLVDIVARCRDGRQRQDHGFGPQIKPGPGIGRVVIGRHDIGIGRRGSARVVTEPVYPADIAGKCRVDRLVVHGLVALDRRIGIKPGLGRDAAGFVRGQVLRAGQLGQPQGGCKNEEEQADECQHGGAFADLC